MFCLHHKWISYSKSPLNVSIFAWHQSSLYHHLIPGAPRICPGSTMIHFIHSGTSHSLNVYTINSGIWHRLHVLRCFCLFLGLYKQPGETSHAQTGMQGMHNFSRSYMYQKGGEIESVVNYIFYPMLNFVLNFFCVQLAAGTFECHFVHLPKTGVN